jgi:hypothetical protein
MRVGAGHTMRRLQAFTHAGFAVIENVWNSEMRGTIQASIQHYLSDTAFGDAVTDRVIEALDLKSDFFFDLARSPELIDLSERLLGMATIAIHIKYLQRTAPTEGDSWFRQNQYVHQDHFSHDAVSLTFPLADPPGCYVNDYSLEKFHEVADHAPLNDRELGFGMHHEGAFLSVHVPAGGCVAHHSYLPYRPSRQSFGPLGRFIVINYRQSPYRQQLRARGAI